MIGGALLDRWSAARQVGIELGWRPRRLPSPEIGVADYYEGMRKRGEVEAAVTFLAAALPRHEGIAWAARVLERAGTDLDEPERVALERALAWAQAPGEAARRAAQVAGEAADEDAPERMLALAVFLSGGSISLPGLPLVDPPVGVSARLAAAAIVMAAHRSADARGFLSRALDLGEAVAERGLAALAGEPRRLAAAR